MIITAFDPGSTTFYATFDSRHPDRIDIGKVEMIARLHLMADMHDDMAPPRSRGLCKMMHKTLTHGRLCPIWRIGAA